MSTSTPRSRLLGPRGPERPWSLYFSNVPQREFAYYARGYHKAARLLARSIKRRRGMKCDALPVLYLYRHAIELLAKAVILSGNRLMELRGEENRNESKVFESFGHSRHRLLPLLASIRETFKFAGWKWCWPGSAVKTFADVERVFRALNHLDPQSFTFRYPTNTRGERSAPSDLEVGLKTMVAVLDELAEALDTAVYGLDAECSKA
jgi:hypothetical protein